MHKVWCPALVELPQSGVFVLDVAGLVVMLHSVLFWLAQVRAV